MNSLTISKNYNKIKHLLPIKTINLKNNKEIKNSLILLGGTIISQAIPLITMPIITRLYSPEQFGIFTLYTSILNTCVVFGSLRYESSLILPKYNKHALSLLYFFLSISIINSIIIYLGLLICRSFSLFSLEKFSNTLIIILALSILMYSYIEFIRYWLIRKKTFRFLAITKIIKVLGTSTSQIALHSITYFGLIYGALCGLISSIIANLIYLLKTTSIHKFKAKLFIGYKFAKKYNEFPKYVLPSTILDKFASQAPFLIAAQAYSKDQLGFLGLAFTTIYIPSIIIANTLQVIYVQKASEYRHSDPNKIISLVLKMTLLLSLCSIPPFLFIKLFGPSLFGLVFGQEWITAGKFAQILIITTSIELLITPLSGIMSITNNIKLGSFWKLLHFSIKIPILITVSKFSITTFLWIHTGTSILLYILYYIFIIKAALSVKTKEPSINLNTT